MNKSNGCMYYFSNLDKKLRYGDGRVIRKGITHKVKGVPILCQHGLHASKNILDALSYAPSTYLWLVKLSGKVVHGKDKSVGTERIYLAGLNIKDILWKFSRKQALINIKKIKPYTNKYNLICEYLRTGDINLRESAWSAAESAAWSAAESAAWSAARSAAWSAAESTRSAAWSAAESAAESAARSAAESTRSAAWSAARKSANIMLEKMIKEELDTKMSIDYEKV